MVPVIDLELGKIINWRTGFTAKVHYRVDSCYYTIEDINGQIAIERNDVPSFLRPKDWTISGCILMDIDCDGMIDKWEFTKRDVYGVAIAEFRNMA